METIELPSLINNTIETKQTWTDRTVRNILRDLGYYKLKQSLQRITHVPSAWIEDLSGPLSAGDWIAELLIPGPGQYCSDKYMIVRRKTT